MKNRDRDEEHRRRRQAGSSGTGPDGKEVAAVLYGAFPDEDDDTDMAHPNVDRSKRREREIVHAAQDAALDADRAWNSNGKSLGEREECDVRITDPQGRHWTVQAKRRKNVASYLTCENADIVVTREDHGENLAVVPLDLFLDLLQSNV